jgi:hypothetical protein
LLNAGSPARHSSNKEACDANQTLDSEPLSRHFSESGPDIRAQSGSQPKSAARTNALSAAMDVFQHPTAMDDSDFNGRQCMTAIYSTSSPSSVEKVSNVTYVELGDVNRAAHDAWDLSSSSTTTSWPKSVQFDISFFRHVLIVGEGPNDSLISAAAPS